MFVSKFWVYWFRKCTRVVLLFFFCLNQKLLVILEVVSNIEASSTTSDGVSYGNVGSWRSHSIILTMEGSFRKELHSCFITHLKEWGSVAAKSVSVKGLDGSLVGLR
jgi:hypothetical protein